MAKNSALLVSTSRFWFNYRHAANVLSVYYILKKFGYSDDRILLMLSDDIPCNSRNKEPGCVYNHYNRNADLFDDAPEVDYSGDQVTLDSFLSVLKGAISAFTGQTR
ncbi:glycosylphosphatidylinositol anchor biosynthesis [Mitosporidium daphniae]